MATGGHNEGQDGSSGPGSSQKIYGDEKCKIKINILINKENKSVEKCLSHFKLCHIKLYSKTLENKLKGKDIDVSSFKNELTLISRLYQPEKKVFKAVHDALDEVERSLVFNYYQIRDRGARMLQTIWESEELKGVEVSCDEYGDNGVAVVCRQTDESLVLKTVDEIAKNLCEEDDSSQKQTSKSDSFEHISSEEALTTVEDDESHLSKRKDVSIELAKNKMETASFDIPLTPELFDFVQQSEPQQFIISEMRKIGMRCQFIPKGHWLRLENDNKDANFENAEYLLHDLTHMIKIPDSHLLNQLFQLKEISKVLTQNEDIAGKIKVFESDKNICILTTRDVRSQVENYVHDQLRVEAKMIHYAEEIISNLTDQDIRELDDLCSSTSKGKVFYKMVQEKGNCGIFVCGTFDAFTSFREKLDQFLDKKKVRIKSDWLRLDGKKVHLKLENYMQDLLQHYPCALEDVLNQAKRLHITLLWDDSQRSLCIAGGEDDRVSQIQNMLPEWIVKKVIPFAKQRETGESFLEDVKAHLMRDETIHQNKVFFMAESSGVILVGTCDVIENAFKLVEEYLMSLREKWSVSLSVPGSSLQSNSEAPEAPFRKKRKLPQGQAADTPDFHINLTEMQKSHLMANMFAQKSLLNHFQKQDFPLHFDLKRSIVIFEVRNSIDRMIIRDIWQKVFVIRDLDIEKEQILISPDHIQAKLRAQFHDLNTRVLILTDKNYLHLTGINELAQPVVESLEVIINDYKRYTMTLSIKDVSKVRCHDAEIKRIEKMDKDSLSRVQLQEGEIILTCPSCHNKEIKHALLEFLDRITLDKGSKDCVMTLPSYMELALKRNSKMKTFVEDRFREKHWVIDISEEIVFSSFYYIDFEVQEQELKAILIIKTLDLTDCLLTPDGVVRKFAPTFGCDFEICYKSDNQVKLVCINDSSQKLDDAFQQITHEFECKNIDRKRVKCGHVSSPDELTRQLGKIKPELQNTAKVIIHNGYLRLIYFAKMSVLALETFEQLCLQLEMKDINKDNPSSKVPLTPLHVCLLQNPDVMHYVHHKVRSEHFQLSCDLKSRELSVFALTSEDAECGRMVVESCFKKHTINLKNHPILENFALSEVADMIQVQHAVHGSKIQFSVKEEEKQITFLCTDDVYEGVLKKVDQVLKQCSRSEHTVEVPSMQVAEFINRFKLKVDFSPKYPQIEAVLSNDGKNAIFELTGEKGDLSSAVQALTSLCDTVKLKEFPLGDSEYNFLSSHQGKSLIAKVENRSKCVVSVYKTKSHMHELKERQNDMTENPFGDQRDETFSTEDLSTGVHLLDLNPSHPDSDVVAVAFVNGELSIEVEAFLKHKSQYEDWKKISSHLLRKQRENTKTKELQSSFAFSSAGNRNPRFAFILLPGGETEVDKETRKSCIGTLLQGCVDLQTASVGMVVDVPDDAIKKVGKQIVRSCLDYSHLQINIFCLREQKRVLEKLLKDAESPFGKIKKIMKPNQAKKELKESSKLEKQICLEVDELSRVKADVLVNSVNKELDIEKGGVAKTLNSATGGKLQAALKKAYPNGIHEGKLAITDSCGLRSKKIFHGNLKPYMPESKSKNKMKDYCQSRWELMRLFIHRCLHEVRSHKYQSVAFPVLGCGNMGYPPTEVVHVMFNSVEQFFEENGQSSVCKVIFVLYPKDKEIIKIFHEEWMARNFGINLNVHPETSISCGRVVLQIFCKDIWNAKGESDGLLCFWNEDQVKDPSKHPIVGEDLEGTKWELFARDFQQKMHISTLGGNLPAKFLYHMRSDVQGFELALTDALKHASMSDCSTLQIPIVDKVSLSWVDFAKTMWKVLQRTDISERKLAVVTLLAKEREIFKTLLENFHQLNNGTNQSNLPSVLDWVSSKLFSSTGPLVAIAALSEASCKKALNDLKSEMKKEGSSVDNPSGITDAPWKVCSDSDSAMHLSNVFLEHPKWEETKAEISKRGIEATEKNNLLVLEGPFEKLSEGVLVIRDMCKIVPTATLDKNDSADLSPEKAIVVSEDHFVAVQHLIGKQEIEECFIVKDKPPSEKQIFFKNFMYDKVKKAEAENIEQRIKGAIQEEVKFSETERKRAEEKVKTMAKNSDMFLIYKPDRNAIVIFTEDWQKMSDAKKKVQSKATSREGRRFASQAKPDDNEDKPATSTSSSKVDEEDTDCFRGKTITVRVYKADITKLDVDVIVNAANGHLSHGAGVAKAIADAAGPSLTREGNALVHKFGQIAVADLAVTTAGNLPCKKVFHAVGPQWPTGSTTKQNQCQIDLCLTILRCLCEAENLKMRSIAIPSISAAIFRVPKNLCAMAYVRALKIFDEISKAVYLQEVHFIDISDTMVEEILAACGDAWNKPVDVSQYDREREFMNMYLENTKKSNPKVSKSSEPTDTLSLVDFFSGHPFTKPADAIVSWENSFGSYQSTISFFLKDGGKDFEEGRRKAHDKCLTFGDVEIGPGGHLPVKHVVYTKVPTAVRSNELLDYLRKILNKTASSDSLVIPVLKDLDKQGIGKDWKMTFVECLVQALQEYSKSNPGRRKILIFAENSTDMQDVQTHFKERVNALSLKQLKEDCSICLEAIAKPSKLKCGHVFCEGCINDAFKVKQACPICKTVCGVITGNMPYGKMDVNHYGPQLPGFEKYKTITIHYNFPDGTQSSDHPHPGEPYRGTRRTAFLPASPEGYEILKLLKVAWDRKLTFTVGRSVTIDDEMDRVTWNEIHHKTKATGGETNHGYPDPGYLKRVKEELAAQGVTLDDLGATGTHV